MKIFHFSLTVPQGIESSDGYVRLRHGTQYTVVLTNDSDARCDAEVMIDGRVVGLWRVAAQSSVSLERPVHDTGKFTFFKVGTPEARAAGIAGTEQTGLLSVVFRPERDRQLICSAARPSAGGTGLTGFSEQEFIDAENIVYDVTREVAIHLRLVSVEDEIRPLFPKSNTIPASVLPSGLNEDGARPAKPESTGFQIRKRHVSLLVQAIALAVIWGSEIGLAYMVLGSILALVAIRGAFGEL